MTKNINTQAMSSTTSSSDTPKYKRKRRKKKKKKSSNKKASKPTNVIVIPTNGKSNWNNLKQKLVNGADTTSNRKTKKIRIKNNRKRSNSMDNNNDDDANDKNNTNNDVTSFFPDPSEYVACDCEMVGVGAGRVSALARASLVNWNGKVVYDKFVRPKGKITDYRTRVSGVRKRDMDAAVNFDRAQREVKELLHGKILVGHALKNDVEALKIKHPAHMVRDSALYRPLLKRNALGKWQANSLKNLSKLLGHNIQSGEHSSVEDARASMMVFRKHRDAWETSILKKTNYAIMHNNNNNNNTNHSNSSNNDNDNNDNDNNNVNHDGDVDIFASKKIHKNKNKRKRSRSARRREEQQQYEKVETLKYDDEEEDEEEDEKMTKKEKKRKKKKKKKKKKV